MEGKGKWASLTVLVGVLSSLFAALATNGEKTLAVLGGVPKLLAAWSSGLPLGTSSVFIAVMFGAGLWLFIIPRLPRMPDGSKAQLMADNIVIPVVTVLVLVQQFFMGPERGRLLMALMVGAVGGFVACWVGRIGRSMWVHIQSKALRDKQP